MASFEFTVLDRMTSDISRLSAMSSLQNSQQQPSIAGSEATHRLLSVARWTCSSICDVEVNQPAIVGDGLRS